MVELGAGVSAVTPRSLPQRCEARTWSFLVGDAKGYLTASHYDDGSVGRIALRMAKQGSTLAGMMDALSEAVTLGLQRGAPLESYVRKLINLRFMPAGATGDPEIPLATSIADYVARRLALEYLPFEVRGGLGVLRPTERDRHARADAAVFSAGALIPRQARSA